MKATTGCLKSRAAATANPQTLAAAGRLQCQTITNMTPIIAASAISTIARTTTKRMNSKAVAL